jgi:hypothetical protein
MTVPSILYLTSETRNAPGWEPGSPLFRDLNLDQVIASVVKGKDAYDVRPFLYQPLPDIDGIVFRQGVFADLEDPETYAILARFAKAQLVATFAYRVKDLREDDLGFNHYHRERFFMNAVAQYCSTVSALEAGLAASTVRSRALLELRDYLSRYVASPEFRVLTTETATLEAALDDVRYCVLVRGDRITVGLYDDEADYSENVARTFERFRQGAVENYLPNFRDMDSFAGAGVLDLVAKVFPELFAQLDAFCRTHLDYMDDAVRLLDRELEFYLAYLEYIDSLRAAGLVFSAPKLSSTDKREQVNDTFDLALAAQLTAREVPVVCNDLTLAAAERILVVSGPNNGGKTTLARTFGQLHYLARLGLPVPGRDAQFYLCDRIFTHFEKEEQITTLAGKLQDELNRLRADFDEATPASVFILNELFNTTSARDGLFLSVRILERVTALDALCVCVTFLDELASLNEKVVSMVATVVPDDPATRTYKVVRRPADGRAYARALAQKYGLTYDQLSAEFGA